MKAPSHNRNLIIKNIISLPKEISYHMNFDKGGSCSLVLMISRHAQTRFLCSFKSTMVTDHNIKNETLASEIDTAYGRYMVNWQCLLLQESFLVILNLFLTYKCTKKPLLGNLFVADRIFFGRLRLEDCHSWKLKTAESSNCWDFCNFFWLYQ